jgi:hypothetical protein
MKARKQLVVVLLIVIAFTGCDRKTDIKDIIDFNVDDVGYIKVIIASPDEAGNLNVTSPEGMQKFIDLLQGIEVGNKLDQTTKETSTYYDYTLTLVDDKTFRLIDYQDKMKIIDIQGKESWYEISSNTWDGLTPLWEEYYTESSGNVTPSSMPENILFKKPVIYLYPTESMEIEIKIDLIDELTYSYPAYYNGWRVLASPDGSLHNLSDNKIYSYLFWEGSSDVKFDMSKGFVVKGEDTTKFLEEKLSYLGLTRKEYNDFIVYWAPSMSENNYNLITFQGEAYTDHARLMISPEPDSLLRVFMVYQPLNEYLNIPEQELNSWKRTGFSVIEWGGSVINN